ncbi:hypothetical protein HDR58_09180 [bacterium]|nr:hypothetical protein [bacterium]
MKKILISLFLILLFSSNQSAFALKEIVSLDETENQPTKIETTKTAPLEIAINFDWLDISQAQRDENIEHYKNLLFENNESKIYFTKEEFKKEFAKFKKDKSYKYHYMLTNEGVTEDEEAKYCAFYSKGKTLLIYAIQYKNNPTNAFYYSAFGKLYYTDITSKEYPNFPYTSMQYNRNGKLKSAIYFLSNDLQYMYDGNKEFQGIWYKDTMYDRNGKNTLTRSNW